MLKFFGMAGVGGTTLTHGGRGIGSHMSIRHSVSFLLAEEEAGCL